MPQGNLAVSNGHPSLAREKPMIKLQIEIAESEFEILYLPSSG